MRPALQTHTSSPPDPKGCSYHSSACEIPKSSLPWQHPSSHTPTKREVTGWWVPWPSPTHPSLALELRVGPRSWDGSGCGQRSGRRLVKAAGLAAGRAGTHPGIPSCPLAGPHCPWGRLTPLPWGGAPRVAAPRGACSCQGTIGPGLGRAGGDLGRTPRLGSTQGAAGRDGRVTAGGLGGVPG